VTSLFFTVMGLPCSSSMSPLQRLGHLLAPIFGKKISDVSLIRHKLCCSSS
jgi:hypothetical protein